MVYEYPAEVVMERARQSRKTYERLAALEEAAAEAYRLLDAWTHATKSQQTDAATGVGQAWSILGKVLGKE